VLNVKNISFFVLAILFVACNNHSPNQHNIDKTEIEESLVKVNKKLVKSEDEQINDFISRYNWDMKQTGSGLRYMIYEHGSGPKAIKGQVAKVNFTVGLLDGTVCYSSDTEGLKEFQIGQGGVERGLEEGILLMKKGDRAKFIIPSHLAFGLLGDENKIPAKAALVYDIELVELK